MARKAVAYLNGIKVSEQELTMAAKTALATNVTFKITGLAHDGYVVCVAYGDGVKDASWKTAADYTLAVTNPIFIDADGDGKYSSPHETAVALLQKINPLTLENLEKAVAEVDAATGVQMMAEARARLAPAQLESWGQLLEKLSEKSDWFLAYRSGAQAK